MKKIYKPNQQLLGKLQRVFVLAILPVFFMFFSSILFSQNTYTFTTAGASGSVGPTQTQATAAYSLTNLNGLVTVSAGIQSFTIANTGLYLIDVTGASGGNTNTTYNKLGGLGSRMMGQFNLLSGDVLKILIGQRGTDGCGTGGGGGGTYCVKNNTLILIAAGGGGGAASDNHAANSTTLTSGTNDNPGGSIPGGINGMGGGVCNTAGANHGGGGGGYLGNGGTSNLSSPGGGGFAFVNNGLGGFGNAPGGFGGGGGGTNCTVGGGGGGGYSGGAGGQQVNYCMNGLNRTGGGGGGSYNAATSATNIAGINSGDGRMILKDLCFLKITSSGTNSLNPILCAGSSLTLTTDAVSNYTWSTGNSTNTTIVVTPSATTTYSIIGTSSMNCVASAAITVTVSNNVPVLTVNASTTQVCLGQTAVLTATGALSYTWTHGVINGTAFTPTATAIYTVSGQNGCGITTAVSSITVAPLQITAVSNPSTVCAGSVALISLTTAATSFSWMPLNIATSVPSLAISPTVTTIYTISVTDGTCSGMTTLTVNAVPVPTISSTSTHSYLCPGNTATLTASGGLTYTWMPGNIVAQTAVVSPATSTMYVVLGENSFGCLGSSSQVILIGTSPLLTVASNALQICSGKSATLTASGGDSYAWVGGPNSNTYVVSPSQYTTYSVSATSTSASCPAIKTISINVFTPSLSITGNTALCTGNSTTLNATGANSYTWNPGSFKLPNMVITPTVSTIFTLSALSLSNSLLCPISETIGITVSPLPTITAVSTKTSLCRNQTFTLTASGAVSYTWSNLTTTLSNSATYSVVATTTGALQYNIMGESAEGCKSTKFLNIFVQSCTGIQELGGVAALRIYPNPNLGEFFVEADKEMALEIFNELGQLVRELKLSAQNEYKATVHQLPDGIYFISNAGNEKLFREKIIVNR